jgi:hypothetical protein
MWISDFLGWFGGPHRISARCEAGHHADCSFAGDGCECLCHTGLIREHDDTGWLDAYGNDVEEQ